MEKNGHPFKQLLVLIGSHLGMLIAAMATNLKRATKPR